MVMGEYMKKALIDTQTSVSHIVSWVEIPDTTPQKYEAVYEIYPNSARVCEVTDTPFEVYPTLIWVDCEDEVVADQYYYDTESKTIKPVENAEPPATETPIEE
jgi:hypothetical protein